MTTRIRARAAALVALACAVPSVGHAQAVIKVNDSISVQFGFLSQTWAEFLQNVYLDGSYAQSIFERRIRLMVGAQVGSHMSFYFETDNPNLGNTTAGLPKSLLTGFLTQDAWVQYKPNAKSSAFLVVAGLQHVPLCRNCIPAVATLLPVDVGPFSFLQDVVTGASIGRDMGFQPKGYLFGDRVEYRVGVFEGARLTSPESVVYSSNSLRMAARVQVQLLEPEAQTYTYIGTYFGRKKVLALGAGIDAQSDYRAWAADAFLSYPFGKAGMTAQANFIHYDGGLFFPTLPRQNTFMIEGGYNFASTNLSPFFQFSTRNVDPAFATTELNQDQRFLQLGAAYYVMGYNLNFKGAYTRGWLHLLPPGPTLTQNGFIFQMQGYYY